MNVASRGGAPPLPILLRGGTVVNAGGREVADVRIEDERIAAVGPALEARPGDEVVDVAGRLVLPGGIDPHVHLDLPMFDTVSSDDHYTGHKAAAFGGTTTAIDFVPQLEEGTLADGVALWREKADPRAAIDFSFHANVTRLDADIAAEIPRLLELGIPTLKVFTAYNGRLRLPDGDVFRVMRIAAAHDMLTLAHCENGDVIDVLVAEALAAGHTTPGWHARTRPAWGAVESVLRTAAMAAQADAALYVVHVNTAGGVDMIRYARERGAKVMGETCLQYLFFKESDLDGPRGEAFVCSPPLRTAADADRIWEGIDEGTLQVVATDHCPFFLDGGTPIDYEGEPVAIPGKELGVGEGRDFTLIPNGLPGIGDRLPVLWTKAVCTGRWTVEQFVERTSEAPARIFGLADRKGRIAPGLDADIAVWDPQRSWTHGVAESRQRTDHNLYEGWALTGGPERVYLRGREIVDRTAAAGEEWKGGAGQGRFLERGPGAPIL